MTELSLEQVKRLLDRTSYKREFEFRVFSDRDLVFTSESTVFIEAHMDVEDSTRPGSGLKIKVRIRTTVPYFVRDKLDFYRWFAQWLQDIECHESQEWFRVDGQVFDDPHKDGRTSL